MAFQPGPISTTTNINTNTLLWLLLVFDISWLVEILEVGSLEVGGLLEGAELLDLHLLCFISFFNAPTISKYAAPTIEN